MKPKDNIEAHDDSLLHQERFLRIGRCIMVILYLISLIGSFLITKKFFFGDKLATFAVILSYLLLSYLLMDRMLRHIASIKHYRAIIRQHTDDIGH